jgi:fermentation-respiration switch protein FrsA (DUF1100 family)
MASRALRIGVILTCYPAWFVHEGFAFIKFNFSFNGIALEGGEELSDLQAFAENNFSIELDDLGQVIDWVETHAGHWNFNTQKIFLIGHSRGGGLVLLKATEDVRVAGVVSWAGVTDLGRYWMGDLLDHWLRDGVQYVLNARTGQQMPMKIQFYHDYINNKHRFDLYSRLHLLTQPVLHIHGTADAAVPYSWGTEFKERHPAITLHSIEGADHVFGSRHPWEHPEPAPGVREVLNRTVSFLNME